MPDRVDYLGPMDEIDTTDIPSRSMEFSNGFERQHLYVHARKALTKRVACGEWGPGMAIPNEIELAREYGLSSGTIRKALDWMEHAGIVSRQQGRGTFVKPQSAEELRQRYDRLRRTDGQPIADIVDKVTVTEGEARSHECGRLRLRPGARVRRTERLRSVDGTPYLLELSVVPLELFPVQSAEDCSLADLARQAGVLLGNGRERISVQRPPSLAAERFGIPGDELLMMLDRVIDTVDGVPAEWRVAYCRTGRNYYETSVGV